MNAFRKLGRPQLLSLVDALTASRVVDPYWPDRLTILPSSDRTAVADAMNDLASEGMSPQNIARMLQMLADERAVAQSVSDRVELVWSGTERAGTRSRDTVHMVQHLFEQAQRSVLIATFALDEGPKAKKLFESLATKMDANEQLRVRMFLNVKREYRDTTTPNSTLLREFAERFRHKVWPGKRRPEVFYDPRALSIEPGPRSCLHAKCVVIDDEQALLTSANFTEAAHERNFEAGVVVKDREIAKALVLQFETLAEHGELVPVPGI